MDYSLRHQFRLAPAPAGPSLIQAAQARYAAGAITEARALCERALAADPNDVMALHLLGVILTHHGDPASAVERLETAALLCADDGQLRYHLGNALLAAGRDADAAEAFAQAIALDPGLADAHNNRGNALRRMGRMVAAMDAYRAALALRPGFAPALYNMGVALAGFGEFAAAIDCYRAVLAAPPAPGEAEKHPLVLESLAAALVERSEHEQAIAADRAWLALEPGAAKAEWNLSLSLLALGRYAEAWPLYERRWEIEGFRDEAERDQPLPVIPDLAACAGRSVLIRREQGRGDVLQFIRYAALLARHARHVGLSTYPDQVALLARSPGLDEVVPEDGPEPAHDLAVSLMSLPLMFGTTVETIPAPLPYLIADPAAVARWRTRLPPARLRVGLCWWGSSHSRRSSIPLPELAPLFAEEEVGFHALQIELPQDQRDFALGTGRIALHDAELPDFDATAALIGALDLVISVDTSVAHLAGGMGKPVWIMLRDSPDWRWMQGRNDSPWYPTARLFRQGRDRDWAPVVAAVRAALRARLAES